MKKPSRKQREKAADELDREIAKKKFQDWVAKVQSSWTVQDEILEDQWWEKNGIEPPSPDDTAAWFALGRKAGLSAKRLDDPNLTLPELFAYIQDNLGKPQEEEAYLGIEIDAPNLTLRRNGKSTVPFTPKEWKLICTVLGAGDAGISKAELLRAVWKNHATDNAADQRKGDVDKKLIPIKCHINADNKGIWTVQEF